MRISYDRILKIILYGFVFFLPFHAIIVTFFKCKLWIDTNILRFWKEWVVILLFFVAGGTFFLKEKRWNTLKHPLVLLSIAYIVSSIVFVFFPTFRIALHSLLWFKYDTFFILCFLIGFFLPFVALHIQTILKILFVSTGFMLSLFLPWYLFWDISQTSDIFWMSKTPSVYKANTCIAFAQNVTGWIYRFQGSFSDPIRASVFLTVFLFVFIWMIAEWNYSKKKKIFFMLIVAYMFLLGIFFAFTKTSMLGFWFWICVGIYMIWTVFLQKRISRFFYGGLGVFFSLLVLYVFIVNPDVFLHPESILKRTENLRISVEMFFFNPLGYGIGIAWPATQLATSPDRMLSKNVHDVFLPENWYIQIFLEQGIIGGTLFLVFMIALACALWKKVKQTKRFLYGGIFVWFVSLLFMANFTHIFEESSTSFILFLLLWAILSPYSMKYTVKDAWGKSSH